MGPLRGGHEQIKVLIVCLWMLVTVAAPHKKESPVPQIPFSRHMLDLPSLRHAKA